MTAIAAGTVVAVHDPRGDWIGWVNQISDGPYVKCDPMLPAHVAVRDPLDSGLAVGQVFKVPWRRFGALPASTRPERTDP